MRFPPYIQLMELPISRAGSGSSLVLGLTSLVGLIGGVYLLQCGAQHLMGKISNKKTKKKDDSDVVEESPSTCNVCCGDLDISNAKNYVKCRTCEKSVCRGLKCADWHPKDGQWECQLCHNSKESLAHTSSWVAEQMSFNQHKFVYPMRARSEVYIPIQPSQDGQDVESTIQFESVSQIGIRNHMNIEERAKIREYVEEIVAEMLGGNLDKIKVGQLSKSENYLQLFDKYHAKLSNLLINVENGLCVRQLSRRGGDLPAIVNGHSNNNNNSNSNNNNNGSTCNINGNNEQNDDSSQTRLRTLIETIIAETLRNSALGFNTGASASVSEISLDTRTQSELNALKQRHRTEHYFEPKIYQDLLATAVLNKIADTEGNNRRRSLISESTPDLSGHNNIDENYNAEALSTTSGSSIEPRSDCSLTDNELVLNTGKTDSPLSLQAALERESVLSDYIAAHMVPLPDFSASVTESEDDNGSVTSSMIADGTWEDNWLFKKKQHSSLQSSATPSSIGMLVPAPRENVRAQIGDRTADEVSDLSEMGSDVEETSLDINDRLLNKHLIGGQNTKLVLDELIDRTSLISHTLPEEHEPAYTEATNPLLLQTQPTDVPTQFIEPPPPMTFQDDQHIEEPILIADQNEIDTDEFVDALDEGCTGFSTVEYTEENPPSVIEILAAMALGPMLAVPASEQQGVITPNEMHTLKELSDLALAEINSRTTDLEHHSLDVIAEEENTDLSLQSAIETTETVGFSIIEIYEEASPQPPETVSDEPISFNPAETPIETQQPNIIPKLDIVDLPPPTESIYEEPPTVNPAEIAMFPQTADSILSATIEAVSEPISSIAEPEITPQVDIVDLLPPTETIAEEPPTVNPAEIAVDPQTANSILSATIEAVSEPTSSIAETEITPQVDIVDLPPPTETIAEEPPTVNPAEIAADPQIADSILPATIEAVSEPTSSIAEPKITPQVDIVDLPPPTETIAEELPTVNPAEIAADPQIADSILPATIEAVSEPTSSIAEPEITPQVEIVDLPPPTETIPEELPTVNPAEIAMVPQTVDSMLPATIEAVSEPTSSIADPEITPQVDIVDLPPPTETISEEPPIVNPAEIAMVPQTVDSMLPATIEALSEPTSSIAETEITPQVDIVDLPPPTETIAEEPPTVNPGEIAVADSILPATIEAVSEPNSSIAEPEITPQVDIVDLPPPTETISEEPPTVNPAEIAMADSILPATIEAVSEPTSSIAEPKITPQVDFVDLLPPTKTIAEEPPTLNPAEIAADPQIADSILPATIEAVSEPTSSIAEPEITPQVDIVDLPPPTETIAEEPPTVNPAEIAADPQIADSILPATIEAVSEPTSSIAEPKITPQVDIVDLPPPTETIAEELPTVNPAEIAADPQIADSILPATIEAVSEPTSSIAEPEITPQVEIVDLPPPTETIAEELPTVNPAEIAMVPQTVDSMLPATIEAVSEPTSSIADPEITPQVDIVDLPPPTETIAEEPPTVNPGEIAMADSILPATIEAVSEPNSSIAEPEITPQVDIVDLPPPTETISEEPPTVNPAEIAMADSMLPATIEAVSEPTSSIAEPEITPQVDIADLPPPTETISEEPPTVNPAEIAMADSILPATIEAVSEPTSSIAEPETTPKVDIADLPPPTESISEEPPTVNSVEIAADPQTADSILPATIEAVSESTSSITGTEITPQVDIVDLPPPTETIDEEPPTVNPGEIAMADSILPATIEAVSEPTSSIAEPEIKPQVDIVDLPPPTETIAEEPPTVNPAEIAVDPQTANSILPATIEAVSEPTSSIAEPEIKPQVDIVDLPPPTETIAEEPPTVNPAEIAVDPQTANSILPATIEAVSEPTSSIAEPEIKPQVDIVDLPPPTETIAEEPPTVNPAEIAVDPQTANSILPATIEAVSEPISSIAEPETTPKVDIVDLPPATEFISEEPPTVNPAEIAVDPQTANSILPATIEAVSEPISSIAEPETTPKVDIVDLPPATESISEELPTENPVEIAADPQTADSILPATIEAVSELTSSIAEPEITPKVDMVDLPPPTESISEEPPTVNPAEIAIADSILPATIEAVSEPISPIAEPEKTPQVDIVDLPPPTESISEELPTENPVEIAADPQTADSILPATIEAVSEPTSSIAEQEIKTKADSSQPDLSKLQSAEKNVENFSVQELETVFTPTVASSTALGSIAEREVKKWYNAVEMPNNPYAPEALKQRISGTQERCMDVPNISPSAEQKALALMANAEDAADRQPQSPQTDYKRYSRDYYINNNNGTTMATNEKIDVARSGQEDVDIVINEAQNASKTAAEHQQDMEEQQLQDRQKATVYKALPAQILEDANSPSPSPSVETQSNPSLATTTTSEDSDTVRIYDFNKQETTVIKQQSTVEQTVETVESSTYSTSSSYSIDSSVVAKKRERPVVLQFGPGDSAPTIGSPMGTPTRGSTPPAFRFLQPKRRLIEPSQVLSIDQDDQDDNVREPSTPLADKPAVEDDVVHALPSVKALAQAFLLTSKHTQPQRRWRARHVRVAASASAPETPDKPAVSPSSNLSRKHRLEHAVSMAEVADESTIASDLSSLETDSSIPSEGGNAFVPPTASPVPVRRGFLRSNIAFFENLKFK
ncbi:mucin-2 isoform X2 [Drosophila tropicalis]|uniref:mucin-2 isoform X2 n=1 Tax=Drosophila tropicalis TaxID=46794 RepID=UPI0035AB82C9